MQVTDEQLAVRRARIVLSCDSGLSAATTAIWLRGMGHDARVLRDAPIGQAAPVLPTTPADLGGLHAPGTLLDVLRGLDYRAAHIKGAVWVNRAQLHLRRPDLTGPITIVGRDASLVMSVHAELSQQGHSDLRCIPSGLEEWRKAGLEIAASPDIPSEAECIDRLFFVHDRHDGNLDAARRHLKWETGLLAQLDDDERAALRPLVART